jgi:chitinase domain-containing protein 1
VAAINTISQIQTMILSRTITFLCFGRIYALNTLFGTPTCQLNADLRGLNAQKLDPAVILKTVAQPGFCSSSEKVRYEKPDGFIKLGFVTPWNDRGYDLAKWFASKFTHISPVWYQLILQDNSKPELKGGHDINQIWLQELKNAYRPPKIIPRVQLQLSQKIAEAILYYPQGQAERLANILIAEIEKNDYDGITLELPAPHLFTALIGIIGDALHYIQKELVIVIPPQHTHEQRGMIFNANYIDEVVNDVDYFVVMTYDHAGAMGREGPNSPLLWIKEVVRELLSDTQYDYKGDDLDEIVDREELKKVRARKILMGLPFYGYKFSHAHAPEASTASNYLDLLMKENRSSISWDEHSKEHRLVGSSGTLWYPSILSLLYRLQLAEEEGVGIAIWELGQGLDQFFDVL